MHRAQVNQFLLFGFTDVDDPKIVNSSSIASPTTSRSSQITEIQRIKSTCDRILHDEQSMKSKYATIATRLEHEISLLTERRDAILSSNLMEKHKKFIETKYQICLLSISKQLQLLSSNVDVRNIPVIVSDILDLITSDIQIPSHTILRQKMLQQCQAISKKVLMQFHDLFESQLKENTNIDSHQRSDKVASDHLDQFFAQAKDWLLGYAMVCMLPFAVSAESKSQCLVKYQDVLDESLTPLWGRFHFHLRSSRDTHSLDQILWSFSYARSFVELLVGICRNISDTGRLQSLFVGDYLGVGMQYIIEKAMRFMRGHVVQLLEVYATSVYEDVGSRVLVTSIIEATLEFDDSIVTIKATDLTVGGAIFDIKSIHAYWVDFDYHYFYERIRKSIHIISDTYAAQFGSNILGSSSSSSNSVSSLGYSMTGGTSYLPFVESDFQVKYSGYRCYRGVYDCLSLLHIACHRYARLSPPSQDIFATVIIEPLLMLSVSILLYRIQTNKPLHRLSTSSSSTSSHKDENVAEDDVETFTILSEFIASAQYLQSGLSSLPPICRAIKVREGRFESRWDSMQSWLPSRYMEEKYLTQKRSSLQGLVETSFVIPGWNKSAPNVNELSSPANSNYDDKLRVGENSLGTFLTNKKSSGMLNATLGRVIDKVKKCSVDICTELETRYQQRLT